MRLQQILLFVFLLSVCLVSAPGCDSNEATVAPRTEEEIAAYKAEVYAAEEEDDEAASEDE